MELFLSSLIAASLAGDIRVPPLPELPTSPKIEYTLQIKEGDFRPPEDTGAPRGRLGGGTRNTDDESMQSLLYFYF